MVLDLPQRNSAHIISQYFSIKTHCNTSYLGNVECSTLWVETWAVNNSLLITLKFEITSLSSASKAKQITVSAIQPLSDGFNSLMQLIHNVVVHYRDIWRQLIFAIFKFLSRFWHENTYFIEWIFFDTWELFPCLIDQHCPEYSDVLGFHSQMRLHHHTAGSRMSSDFVSRYCYCIMAVLVEGFSEVFAVSVALAPINKISANAL